MPTCYIDEEIVWQSIQCLDKAIETAFPPMEEEEEEPVTEEESPIVNVSEEEVSNGAMPESENNKE